MTIKSELPDWPALVIGAAVIGVGALLVVIGLVRLVVLCGVYVKNRAASLHERRRA